MKIFHRYAGQKSIPMNPTKGDFVTERQIINTMNSFGTVVNKNADIYYVRANKKLFLSLPHPKVYFASPYDKACWKAADGIATFSDEWTRLIKAGKPVPCTANPGHKSLKRRRVFTIIQSFSSSFKPLQNHPRTKMLRRKMGGGFIIGHYGKMRKNRIPHTLIKLLPKLKKEYPKLNVIFSDVNGFNTPHIKEMSFRHEDMPYVMSASDMLILTTWSNCPMIAGCTRCKEGLAVGVPHIMPRWPAREEEFGKDYPYFHEAKKSPNGRYNKKTEKNFYDTIVKSIEDDSLRKKVSKDLIKRSKKYTVEAAAKKMEKDFLSVING